MRRVAAELGTGAASLYRYLDTREDLLDLMIDASGSEYLATAPTGDWLADLLDIGDQARAIMRRHPWLAPLLITRSVLGPNGLALLERILEALASHPASTAAKLEAFALLNATTALFVQNELAGGPARQQRNATYLQHALAAGHHPRLAELLTPAAAQSSPPEAPSGPADRPDPDDARYLGFNGIEIVRAARWLPEVAAAMRHGGGPPPLPWAPEGRPEFNRAVFLNLLAKQWLPAIADVDLRLRSEPPARVADLACGTGWSSIAMAQAYPLIAVDGFDLDADAIQAARRNAEEAGLADRVTFTTADASGPGVSGQYDLVTILEALHDMSRPVDALRVARGMLTGTGCVIVADEAVEDEFTAPASLEEQYHYSWSVVACLPAVMGDQETAATGAVMRPATLRQYALEAGFRDLEVLPVKAEMLRFYRLTR